MFAVPASLRMQAGINSVSHNHDGCQLTRVELVLLFPFNNTTLLYCIILTLILPEVTVTSLLCFCAKLTVSLSLVTYKSKC